ncbi:MAG: DUF11 domain-containing protein [Proteobacteria bacterium]|nr:DUF11 domain-containing protein [Pseudomonadota bacterium]
MKRLFAVIKHLFLLPVRPRGLSRVWCLMFACLVIVVHATPLYAAYVKRYSTVANGAMSYTGNTLGLNKAANANAPGTSGAIGAFITLNNALRDGTYPYGTTADWTLNASSAVLSLPSGSTVLYAELIWGGSYRYGTEDVTASLGTYVTFNGLNVSPSSSTATTLGGGSYYYVRSADVTATVKATGAGTYTVGHVPGTQSNSENNANTAGWTLAVVYGNPSLPVRNMTVFVGGELTNTSIQTLSSVSGFCTPQKGTINARLMVSTLEGDSGITGDQMLFGPTSTTLAAVSGTNNPIGNFFASQINTNAGTLDTSGTFGGTNSIPGSNTSGARQGWDITNVDVSSRMQNGQSTAYAKGSTTGDVYVIASIGLQIAVGSPIFPTSVMTVNKTQTYLGDTLTFTVRLDNTAGTADALNVLYTNTPANGLSFVPGSLTMNGVSQPSANPNTEFSVGTVAAGSTVTLTFKMNVSALPLPPAVAQFQNSSYWTYQYSSCSGFPLNNGITTTAPYTAVTVPRLQPSKSAVPPGSAGVGDTVIYTISIPNTGTGNSSGTTLADPIPTGTLYVPGSTTMNSSAVADISGNMPFAVARQVNSPGAVSGQITAGASAVISFRVTIGATPPAIITNIATIDPDGPGPAAGIVVSLTNPPVTADLAVAVTDNQTTAIAGNPIAYVVTLTNNGPDTIISANLLLSIPAAVQNPVIVASSGTYDQNSTLWSGLNLAIGQSVTLTLTGTVSPSAMDSLVFAATVAAAPGVLDSNSANNTASDTDTLTYQADLSITKTDGKTSVQPGSSITYTITVLNSGPSRVDSLTVVDTLPVALLAPVFTPSQGVYNEENGFWTGVNLLPGGTLILTLNAFVDVTFKGALSNTATVSPPVGVLDVNLGNNSATDTDTTTPAVSITKSVNKATALPGDELIFSSRYWNQGGGNAKNLAIQDAVPVNTHYVAGSLRMGNAISTYDTATSKTDTVGDDEAEINTDNTSIVFRISDVAPDDTVPNSGPDEGVVYFKVTVK